MAERERSNKQISWTAPLQDQSCQARGQLNGCCACRGRASAQSHIWIAHSPPAPPAPPLPLQRCNIAFVRLSFVGFSILNFVVVLKVFFFRWNPQAVDWFSPTVDQRERFLFFSFFHLPPFLQIM